MRLSRKSLNLASCSVNQVHCLVQLFDFFVKGPALVLRRLSKRLTMGRLPEGENKARLSISFSAESEAARVSSLG